MTERCIVRIKFTPAGTASEVRRAVGGFLRYVQHRDLHPDSAEDRAGPEVAGLLKYVAYRDQASARAELFGPDGAVGTHERKAFAEFVARSLEISAPQLFRTRDGRLMDRRRAVSRLILSPERAQGLDLEQLTRAAMAGLASEVGSADLQWIAAIHRNTRHHHVHLVVAGMQATASRGYRRVDIDKARLAAIKESVALEIQRQRAAARTKTSPQPVVASAFPRQASPTETAASIGGKARHQVTLLPSRSRRSTASRRFANRSTRTTRASSVIALRAVARRYSWEMKRETEDEARRLGWERAA